MKWLYSISDSVDMNLSKIREIVKVREAWCAIVHGAAEKRMAAGVGGLGFSPTGWQEPPPPDAARGSLVSAELGPRASLSPATCPSGSRGNGTLDPSTCPRVMRRGCLCRGLSTGRGCALSPCCGPAPSPGAGPSLMVEGSRGLEEEEDRGGR